MKLSERKLKIRDSFDSYADDISAWKQKNWYFHEQDIRYLKFLVPDDARILDLGCGTGDLLSALNPHYGTGIDFSAKMIERARTNHPHLVFEIGDIEDHDFLGSLEGEFDYIILSDTIGSLDDCQSTLSSLHKLCKPETRIIISYYSYLWEPILKLAEYTGLKMPQAEQNYLTTDDIVNLMTLSYFDMVKYEWKQLIPLNLGGLGNFINRYIATLPFIRNLCVRNYVVGRSLLKISDKLKSCSVVIPCRNEKGNIEQAITRIPEFCDDLEVIFVEGHSEDGTIDEIKRIIEKYHGMNIKLLQQPGVGKADATFCGFDFARGDVLMILDADLTMPPEQLTKFWDAINKGQGEYINGSRLVYPMEGQAMRFMNFIANRLFSFIFTWLLNQRYTDTLCGTKVLKRTDYKRMKDYHYFDAIDPFGDFNLIFGSSKLNLKMIEIPIVYTSRQYGETQIHRFRHGLYLLRMVLHGYRKMKAI